MKALVIIERWTCGECGNDFSGDEEPGKTIYPGYNSSDGLVHMVCRDCVSYGPKHVDVFKEVEKLRKDVK